MTFTQLCLQEPAAQHQQAEAPAAADQQNPYIVGGANYYAAFVGVPERASSANSGSTSGGGGPSSFSTWSMGRLWGGAPDQASTRPPQRQLSTQRTSSEGLGKDHLAYYGSVRMLFAQGIWVAGVDTALNRPLTANSGFKQHPCDVFMACITEV